MKTEKPPLGVAFLFGFI